MVAKEKGHWMFRNKEEEVNKVYVLEPLKSLTIFKKI
jgi:hypothetical protein